MDDSAPSPWKKAQRTARWARIMTKWLIRRNANRSVKWQFVEFGGSTGTESRGIVDILAIRKDHRTEADHLKRGDLFDMVLIQTKGGQASFPTEADIERLETVAQYHRAQAVVLAEWRPGTRLCLYHLREGVWHPISPSEVFG